MGIGGFITSLAIATLIIASPGRGQSQETSGTSSNSQPGTVTASTSDPSAGQTSAGQSSPAVASLSDQTAPAAAASPAVNKTFGEKVNALVKKIAPERLKRDIEFRTASETFPQFCQHWGQNLREREANNLQKLKYIVKQGFETATYTGYGKISTCEAHQSKDGYSIGKITYEEFIYYVTGKTRDDARKAAPQTVSDTRTTEIFRWENNKWFY
jgi:hypothetical protein